MGRALKWLMSVFRVGRCGSLSSGTREGVFQLELVTESTQATALQLTIAVVVVLKLT